MSRVLVVSPERIPIAPCTPARARWLLTHKQAAVLRRYPFTLVLLREPSGTVVPSLRLKIDPGSKTTGLAIVNDTSGEVEHIVPTSRDGSDRVSNLTLACHACNQAKGKQTAEEFGHPEVQARAKIPLRDAAAVNASRWVLYQRLQMLGLPLETGSGGQTQYNRTQRCLPKTHWVDASCVGSSTPAILLTAGTVPMLIGAQGRHSRQMCRTNSFGFPDKGPKATSVVGGFRTGDLVRAVVPPSSSKAGTYVGRIAVRATGSCNLQTASGTIEGIHVRYCQPLQRGDGYSYQKGPRAFLPIPSRG